MIRSCGKQNSDFSHSRVGDTITDVSPTVSLPTIGNHTIMPLVSLKTYPLVNKFPLVSRGGLTANYSD